MKLLNARLVVSAIGIATMTTSPAFAQKSHHHLSQQYRMKSDPVPGSGRGVYNMVPNLDPEMVPNLDPDSAYNVVPNAYGPGVAGDNKW